MPSDYQSEALSKLKRKLPTYLAEVKQRPREEPRKILFAGFLQEVFEVSIEEFSRLMERFVESKALLVRGRVDAVFGNLVIEFKSNLKADLEVAKSELLKYLQGLREEMPAQPFLGLATDGVAFIVFKPVSGGDGTITDLKKIDSINLDAESDLLSVYLWFDSYLFSGKGLAPVTEDLRRRFGVESPTFAFVYEELLQLLDYLKDEPSVKLKLSSWAKYLEIAYGTKLGSSDLFAKHTYLATLAKIVIFERLEQGRIPTRQELPDILNGNIFRNAGIMNLVDEDFFTWVLHPRVSHRVTNLVASLLKELQVYDLAQVSEDVFKELYQQLVDPEIRHGLGEYYTPDWIAHYIVRKLLDDNPDRSMIDPACGSGTFLFVYLREVKERRKEMDKPELLRHLLDRTAGIDIHPLAVIIARANYLLAIQDLLEHRSGPITIPIYLSDAIRLPPTSSDIQFETAFYKVDVDGARFFALPQRLVKQRWILDQLAQKMFEVAKSYESRQLTRDDAVAALGNSLGEIWSFTEGEVQLLRQNMELLLTLIDEGSDSIWTFIMRNIYQPLALSQRKFDTIVGNPPWLVMREMKNEDYQRFLKSETKAFSLLSAKETHLFPHMELATVFWCKCAATYAKEGARIAFVLPRSVLVSKHHVPFLRFAKPPVKLDLIIDFDQIRPHKVVFNVPSCALLARIQLNAKTEFPVPRESFKGTLRRRNSLLDEALDLLTMETDSYGPPSLAGGTTSSPYQNRFFEGATIVPRAFWFVSFSGHPTLGIDPERPRVESEGGLEQKRPWMGVKIEGNVEAEFIFGTLLGGDLVPFAHFTVRPVILPCTVDDKFRLFSGYSEPLARGKTGLANWLAEVERLWRSRATEKSMKGGPYVWLNYRGKLVNQRPRSPYKVLYTASATDLTACVLDCTRPLEASLDGSKIRLRGFAVESKTYWYDTTDEKEAHYLSAILNSGFVNQAIKASQTRGLWGPRDIHKRPLSVPFPEFNPGNSDHKELARLGQLARDKAVASLRAASEYKSVARKRAIVRQVVSGELTQIDQLISAVVGQ